MFAIQYRDILLDELKSHLHARLQIIEDPPGPPVQSTYVLKVKSDNVELLEEAAFDLEQRSKKLKEVKDIDISREEDLNKYVLSIYFVEITTFARNTDIVVVSHRPSGDRCEQKKYECPEFHRCLLCT